MLALALFRTLASAAVLMPWLLNLATRLLGRALNMPEPLLHSTGAFVFAQVAAVESSIGRSLCPVRLWRRIRAWFSEPT